MKSLFRHSKKQTVTLAGAIAVAICVLGGGAYAALGGVGHTATTSDIELQNGLIGWWKLDGNAKDATPNAFNGTVTGATLVADRKGKANSAYSFNGSSYINVAPWAQLTGASSRTIAVWFKTTVSTVGGMTNMMIDWGSNSAGAGSYLRFYNGTVGIDFTSCGSASNEASYIDGNWHLLVGTYNGSVSKSYVDGALKTTTSCTVNTTSTELTIGGADSTVSGIHNPKFTGSLDDARIYNRALSAAEITALYKQYDPGLQAASGESGLVGWWKMDGNAKDATPYGNSGIVTGAALATDRKGSANSAYNFNGASSYIMMANTTPIKPTNAISFGAWVKPTTLTTANTVKLLSTTEGGGYSIMLNNTASNISNCPTNSICSFVNVGGTYAVAHSSISGIAIGSWSNITATYDGSISRLYVNGTQTNSVASSGSITQATAPLCIGAEATSSGCSGEYLNGSIDDLRIYNRALSATEVIAQYGSYNSQVSVSNLQSGLIGDWPMNGNAKDATPYSDNGTVTGAALTSDRKGRANSAYSFASASSNNISLPGSYNSGTMTVAAWANSSDVAAFETIAARWNTSTPVDGDWILGISSITGKYRFVTQIAGTQYPPGCTTTVAANTWHLVVGTYDGTTVRIYLDGTQCGTSTVSGSLAANAHAVRIGARTTNDNYWNGSIDDVRIWNRALSSSEITTLYSTYR